jgi:lysozyme
MTLEEMSFAVLAVLEGCKLTAYRDSGNVLTIGIGHTGADVTAGLTISEDQALQLFKEDCAPLLAMVQGKPPATAAALVSFGFNCGKGALQNVLAGHDLISNPVHTQDRRGNTLPGLVNRRRFEEALMACDQETVTQ